MREKNDVLEENESICAICLDNTNEIKAQNKRIVSTKCGHIFCKNRLVNALKVLKVCPTCAKPMKNLGKQMLYHKLYI